MADSGPIGSADRSAEGRGRTTLITGASSGIGRALAELAAAKGYDVVPVARRRELLEALAAELRDRFGATVEPIVGDLADPATPTAVLAELGRPVDVLICNAGDSRVGRFDQLPWELHASRMQLMGLSSWQLAHGTLGGMVERGWGRVVFVSSIGAHFSGFPNDVAYGGIKSMLLNFSAGLDAEYRGLGVRSTVSVPGPTSTEIFQHEGTAADVGASPLFRHFLMTPEFVARETYAASMAGRPHIAPGRMTRALIVPLDHAPRPVRHWMSRTLCTLMKD